MKLARLILVMSVGILAGIAASNTFAQQSPATALGIVVKAENALIGNAALTEGATIYTADYLSTTDNGSLCDPYRHALARTSTFHCRPHLPRPVWGCS